MNTINDRIGRGKKNASQHNAGAAHIRRMRIFRYIIYKLTVPSTEQVNEWKTDIKRLWATQQTQSEQ